MADSDAPDADRGLTPSGVSERVRKGLTNAIPPSPSRTVGEILRANLITRFNGLMLTLVVVVLIAGAPRDALFGGVIIANSLVGIVQEIRAKRVLDQLAVLSAPVAYTVRDGVIEELTVDELVLDDVLDLRPGGQIPADGVVLRAEGLEIDESLLTGEADPETKTAGDELFSGSFVVTGSGRARVAKVGADAYAAQLAEEARRFALVNSELMTAIDRIVTWISWALIPVGTILLITQIRVHENNVRQAMVKAVAGMVGMVPEGLILLTSVAFAVGVVRLARQHTLVRELPAIETLARVDVLCLDKTGTITEGSMVLDDVVTLEGADAADVDSALAAIACSDPHPNQTQQALVDHYCESPAGWDIADAVPFSSARKWSAANFGPRGWWVLGAPEMVMADDAYRAVRARVDNAATAGTRVLLLAHTTSNVDADGLPDDIRAVALIMVSDLIREDAHDTFRYFADQDVTLKVISGDNPVTVGAVAERAGLATSGDPIDARELSDDPEQLADAVEATTVFGRVSPHRKREMVKALQMRGHTVAMTGDGVNDVLALKDSDCGIAMASGSEATRAVAQIVLLDNTFSSLPRVVAEGRRVINNLSRVASLFLTKTTYAIVFALVTGIGGLPYPFLPRQLTLISTLCIGVPSFFLALAPNTARVEGNFLRTVARDSIPYGLICAAATLVTFLFARTRGLSEAVEGTAATYALAGCSLIVLLRNARPLRGWKLVLVTTMGLLVAAAFELRIGRHFFALRTMPPEVFAVGGFCIGGAAVAMVMAHELFDEERSRRRRRGHTSAEPVSQGSGSAA